MTFILKWVPDFDKKSNLKIHEHVSSQSYISANVGLSVILFACVVATQNWMVVNKLKLKADKTDAILICSPRVKNNIDAERWLHFRPLSIHNKPFMPVFRVKGLLYEPSALVEVIDGE